MLGFYESYVLTDVRVTLVAYSQSVVLDIIDLYSQHDFLGLMDVYHCEVSDA